MAQKPSIPKGTRDFSPTEVSKRNYIFDVVKKHFKSFGFQPIETPAFENSNTLLGKYGDEGDRLIFKILNSGDFINKVDDVTYSSKRSSSIAPKISDKALRYDLTVPFARYVVQHQNEITFPFKRYQIQPVWRADRPQKGRYREFYQCDADVVGSTSLLQEIELIRLYDAVFSDLKLTRTTIKINNRKILAGIAEVIGAQNHLVNFTVALDKLDKIGEANVQKEMRENGISETAIHKAAPLFSMSGSADEQLAILSSFLSSSELGTKGVEELRFIFEYIHDLGLQSSTLNIDVTLARGLNYYTGAIFEVAAPKGVEIGSIGGGGRYDDLTGIFGLKNVSGVGISFGLDRIYLVLAELGLFPEAVEQTLDILFINFGEKEALEALRIIEQLRNAGLRVAIYPSDAKMQKQMKYANSCKVPYVVLMGPQELKDKTFVVKNMTNGEQHKWTMNSIEAFANQLNP